MIFDTSEKGLQTIFKPYQAALLEHIWELNSSERVGVSSNDAFHLCLRVNLPDLSFM
jgi:hypothetical protein